MTNSDRKFGCICFLVLLPLVPVFNFLEDYLDLKSLDGYLRVQEILSTIETILYGFFITLVAAGFLAIIILILQRKAKS